MSMKSSNQSAIIAYVIIFAVIFWSFYSLLPRTIKSSEISLENFSIERALVLVKEISKKPHFIGAEAHAEVRSYIVSELQKLGLEVEIQKQPITNVKWRASAIVHNIITRIPGENHSDALMLLSHYDSSPHSSLGASDAGSGVATILEGVRAYLAGGSKPKNDIIILISDGEELGLLGAKAFVKYHPWAKEVKLILNFEARGSGGPSYMLLETNQGNMKFIEAFAKANPAFPVSNSIAYSIYKSLPNDTDLTVFREDADIDGFNFAFIDDHFDYHTAQDSFDRLDTNSLAHQGTYLMALLNYFSNESITNLKSEKDYIFFNLAPFGMIYYPFSWIFPILIITVLIFISLLIYGFYQGIFIKKEVLKGFIPLFLSLISVALFSHFGWKALQFLYPQYGDMINKFTYNGSVYIIAFSAISSALVIFIYQKYVKSISLVNLMIAPMFLWLILSILTSYKLVGGSYVIIPLIFGLMSLLLVIIQKKIKISVWWHSLLAFPLIMLFMPFVYMLPVALGLSMMVASSVLLALILALLLPIIFSTKNMKIVTFLLIIGILTLVLAHLKSDFDDNRKKPNSLVYLMNIDENTASWLSFDKELDSFTEQFLLDESEKPDDELGFKSKFNTTVNFQQKTELIDIAPPTISVVSDSIIDYQRIINIFYKSNRNANKIEMVAMKPLRVFAIEINGDLVKSESDKPVFMVNKNKQVMSYYFSENEPVMISLKVSSFEEFDINLYETKFDLLDNNLIKIEPRSNDMMPKPYVTSDATVIVERINLPVYEK